MDVGARAVNRHERQPAAAAGQGPDRLFGAGSAADDVAEDVTGEVPARPRHGGRDGRQQRYRGHKVEQAALHGAGGDAAIVPNLGRLPAKVVSVGVIGWRSSPSVWVGPGPKPGALHETHGLLL